MTDFPSNDIVLKFVMGRGLTEAHLSFIFGLLKIWFQLFGNFVIYFTPKCIGTAVELFDVIIRKKILPAYAGRTHLKISDSSFHWS